MATFKSSGLLVLAAVTALVGTSIPALGAMPGQAPATSAATATAASAGTLTLRTTSAGGIVEFAGESQEFREGSQCSIVQDAGEPDLLMLEGFVGETPGAAGFRNGDIGVFEPSAMSDPNNAAQCFRVDDGSFIGDETLGLALGQDVLGATLPLIADDVTVSLVRSSKSGSIKVELLEGGDVVYTRPDLITWNGGKPGSAIPTGDLNPDDIVFTGIRLTADSGSFSLRGATFNLVYSGGILDCLDEPVVLEGEGDAPAVTIRRLNNADPAETCELIPYTLSNGDGDVVFLKPLDEQLSAQFLIDIVWTVRPANTDWQSAGPLLPETTIDYEQGGGEIVLRWCPDVTRDAGGEATGIADVLDNEAVVDQDALPGTQFTCIISSNATVIDGGAENADYVILEQQLYLIGDARMGLK